MRRSELLSVMVFCPHFQKPVVASKNLTIDRLVACAGSEACRPHDLDQGEFGAPLYPRGCPVFPTLTARQV